LNKHKNPAWAGSKEPEAKKTDTGTAYKIPFYPAQVGTFFRPVHFSKLIHND